MAVGNLEYLQPNEYARLERLLLENMRRGEPRMRRVLEHISDHWGCEDGVYRFYHQSFKVFDLQEQTEEIIAALVAIAPEGRTFCRMFQE